MRKFCFIAVLIICCLFAQKVFSADLTTLYGSILPEKHAFLSSEFEWYRLYEEGVHGGASFDYFNADPQTFQLRNVLKYGLSDSSEINILYSEMLPVGYTRFTRNNSDVLAAKQYYRIDHFRELGAGFRKRFNQLEVFAGFRETEQRASSYFASPDEDPSVANYTRSHLEEFEAGIRFCTDESAGDDFLDKFGWSLVAGGEFSAEVKADIHKGVMRRNTLYNSGRLDLYSQKRDISVVPQLSLQFGVSRFIDLFAGVSYATPYDYEYVYRRHNADSSYLNIRGDYALGNSVNVPLSVRFRTGDSWAAKLGCELEHRQQSLDYSKNDNGVVSEYDELKTRSFSLRPSFSFIYYSGEPSGFACTDMEESVGYYLPQGKYTVSFTCMKDITHLNRRGRNSAQNILDPDNIFAHPLDLFYSGTEQSAFLTGNSSGVAGNCKMQDYFLMETELRYGVFPSVDLSTSIGFNSGMSQHHFTLSDMQERFLEVKPYWCFGGGINWMIVDNVELSIRGRLVPDYVSILKRSSDPERFKSENTYVDCRAKVSVLF